MSHELQGEIFPTNLNLPEVSIVVFLVRVESLVNQIVESAASTATVAYIKKGKVEVTLIERNCLFHRQFPLLTTNVESFEGVPAGEEGGKGPQA